MCLFPKLIKNRKYTKTKKNGGVIPAITDKRTQYVPVGCGKCMECQKQRAREWQVRLLEEIRTNKMRAYFVTLTFSNESIAELGEDITLEGYERDNQIATKAVKNFLNRWRKHNKKSVRHWLITELGHAGTENIHLHGIIWTDKDKDEINKRWNYGYTDTGKFVNEQTVNYITKYVHKVDKEHKEYKAKVLCSKGIGSGYINRLDSENNRFRGKETNEAYRTRTGHKMAMPKYYRNAIYTEQEREQLWIQLLDKEERYVNGKHISIKGGEEKYYKELERARELNKELGYGDDSKNWERIRYENDRRNIKYLERINKRGCNKGDKNN